MSTSESGNDSRRRSSRALHASTRTGRSSLVATTGECKQGMDVSYKEVWGYHPLAISLAECLQGGLVPAATVSRAEPGHVGWFPDPAQDESGHGSPPGVRAS